MKISRLINANIYIGNNNLLGTASEVNLPSLKAKTNDFESLGMFGTLEFNSGIDKMEASIKWNHFDASVLALEANMIAQSRLQVHGYIQEHQAGGTIAERAAVVVMTVGFKEFQGGMIKPKEQIERESQLSVYEMTLSVDGTEIVMFSAIANIYRVNGVDLLARYRGAIGQ